MMIFSIPLHTVCVGIILMHGKRASIYEAVCNALYWLAADNGKKHTLSNDILPKKSATASCITNSLDISTKLVQLYSPSAPMSV